MFSVLHYLEKKNRKFENRVFLNSERIISFLIRSKPTKKKCMAHGKKNLVITAITKY